MKLLYPENFLDIGYMAENFTAFDTDKNKVVFHRSENDMMQVLFAFDEIDPTSKKEIEIIDALFSSAVIDLACYIVTSKVNDHVKKLTKRLKKCQLLIDDDEEFCCDYGLQSSESGMIKALFLIGKEGAIYHVQTPKNENTPFDLEELRVHLNKTHTTYSGEGCHG